MTRVHASRAIFSLSDRSNDEPNTMGTRHDAMMVDDFQTVFNWPIDPWGASVPSVAIAPDLLDTSIATQIT